MSSINYISAKVVNVHLDSDYNTQEFIIALHWHKGNTCEVSVLREKKPNEKMYGYPIEKKEFPWKSDKDLLVALKYFNRMVKKYLTEEL